MLFLVSSLIISQCEYQRSWFPSGHYGWGFAIKDSLLIAQSGYGADIFNVASPNTPKYVSSLMTPGYSFDVEVGGNFVYVCDDYAGLRIFDISNPSSPVEVGHIDTPGLASKVFIKDTIAYLADDWDGLRIIDIRNPEQPVELGFFDTPGRAIWVDIVDTLAYIADFTNGLVILNVKEPTNPQFVGQWIHPNLGCIWAVDVIDTFAYVTGNYLVSPRIMYFFVLNVSNPSAPYYVSGISPPTFGYGFVIKDTIAFVNANVNGVRIINIANPLNLYEIDSIPGFHLQDLLVADSLLFTAYSSYWTIADHSLRIYNISNPDSVYQIGEYRSRPLIIDVVCAEDSVLFVYASKEFSGIMAFNCATPDSIIFLDSLLLSPGSSSRLLFDSPYLYVSHANMVSILRFMNNYLRRVSTIYNPTTTNKLAKKDNYLFAGSVFSQQGLRIYDVANPSAPQFIASLPVRCKDIVFLDTFAFVLYDFYSYVINIARPIAPFIVCSLYTQHFGQAIATLPPYLIVGHENYCLQIIDVSDPVNPQIVNTILTYPYRNYDLIILDSLLFVAGNWIWGLRVYDISNPITPVLIDSCDTPGYARVITNVGDYIYVADYFSLGLIKCSNLFVSEGHREFVKADLIAYPNPFKKVIRFYYKPSNRPLTADKATGVVKVYNCAGQLIKEFSISLAGGSFLWDGCDNNGRFVSPGVYFVRLVHNDSSYFKKIVLIK